MQKERPSYDEIMHENAVLTAKYLVERKRRRGLVIICFGLMFDFLLAVGFIIYHYPKIKP